MIRDEDDLQLLAELGGVLDQAVGTAGLTSGSYLVLRELVANPAPRPITTLAGDMGADPDEVATLCGRLVSVGLAATGGAGVAVTEEGLTFAAALERDANEAMRAYVVERPHTATVYGLVASMQSGRFTVEDLLAFLSEGPTADDA